MEYLTPTADRRRRGIGRVTRAGDGKSIHPCSPDHTRHTSWQTRVWVKNIPKIRSASMGRVPIIPSPSRGRVLIIPSPSGRALTVPSPSGRALTVPSPSGRALRFPLLLEGHLRFPLPLGEHLQFPLPLGEGQGEGRSGCQISPDGNLEEQL